MIEATDIAFTYCPVTDMARSRKFYEGILGLEPARVVETEGGPLVEYSVGSATLSIGQMDIFPPSHDGVIAALEVQNFEAAISALQSDAVEFYLEPFETPIGEIAVILDPDGSKICIHKRKLMENS